jgi:DNA uptake protein ComE-like DNA-binding protein
MANNATYDQLRYEATLTSTASNNIIAARPIATMDALAAVPYVGTAALTDIKNYIPAWKSSSTTQPSGAGGTYDGVTFTDDEAVDALDIANRATFYQLTEKATVTTTSANSIIAARPIATMDELAAVPNVAAAALTDIKNYIPSWPGMPVEAPAQLSVNTLAAEAANNGTSSTYYDKIVVVNRAIITSEPYTHSSGAVSFWIADTRAGNVKQLKAYIDSSAGMDTGFASIFDDVKLMGKFTQYGSTWEILLDNAETHSITLNKSGVKYGQYSTLMDAWKSTAANPEGAVLLESSFGYWYKVPLPIFLDHPMWYGGSPTSALTNEHELNHSWMGEAMNALAAWYADGKPTYIQDEVLRNPNDQSGGGGYQVTFDPSRYAMVVPAGDNATDPPDGKFAMTVKENGVVVRWSIDGEGPGWMLMIGNVVALWGGISRDRVFDPTKTYTISYYTKDIQYD